MTQQKERRSLTAEIRAKSEDSRLICGYAAKYESESGLIDGWFKEVIARGAFDNADLSDVIVCFNHIPATMMARTLSGTLKLTLDEVGLYFEFEAPDTTHGNDCLTLVRRGDLNKCSFVFWTDKDHWDFDRKDYALRTIVSFKEIFDVSIVIDPAYADTEVSARFVEQRSKFDSQNKETTRSTNPHIDRDRQLEIMRIKALTN